MATLKGYFDDSGNVEDPNQGFFAIGGYVADVATWNRFEVEWGAALTVEFGVSYLHMKELTKCVGEFASLGNPRDQAVQAQIARIQARMARVIVDSKLHGFHAVISLRDLERFNAESGRNLDAKALAVYGAMLEVRRVYKTGEVEIVLDRMVRARAAIALAIKYGQTDTFYPFMRDFPGILPLSKSGGGGCRDTPALQAADFLAWEVRKQCEQRKDLLARVSPSDPSYLQQLFQFFLIAKVDEMKRKGMTRINVPAEMQRRSLTALSEAPTEGFLWDYAAIRRADHLRGGIWCPDGGSDT